MINNVVLVGRITKDPEVTQTNGGASLVRFTIACNRTFKDANGERQADFINCVAWRFQADFMKNYVKKGNLISVTGRIQTGSYTDSENNVRYTTDVVAESVSNLEPRQDSNNNNSYNNNQNQGNAFSQQSNFEQPSSYDVSDEDLPF